MMWIRSPAYFHDRNEACFFSRAVPKRQMLAHSRNASRIAQWMSRLPATSPIR
jgi:hypothetical protein